MASIITPYMESFSSANSDLTTVQSGNDMNDPLKDTTRNETIDRYEGFGSEEELNLAKLDLLRKLGELAKKHNVVLTQNYNMKSSYKTMKYEYALHAGIVYEGFESEEELNFAKLDLLRKLGELAKKHNIVLTQNYNMASSYKTMKYEYTFHAGIVYEGFGSEEELNLAKISLLWKLTRLTKTHGITLTQNYNINSNYKTMKYEYDLHTSILKDTDTSTQVCPEKTIDSSPKTEPTCITKQSDEPNNSKQSLPESKLESVQFNYADQVALFCCDLCDKSIPSGNMFTCGKCPNFDVCNQCFPNVYWIHDKSHSFYRTHKDAIVKCSNDGDIQCTRVSSDKKSLIMEVLGRVAPNGSKNGESSENGMDCKN